MTSITTDMSFMDLLLDREDPLLKESLKDEIVTEEHYRDDPIAAEEWPTNTDDLFDSIFKLDNQFNLIENDLDEMPSSSSDSGLSSVLSLSCEQQLSPLLPIEEDQIELTNSNLGSPPNFMDFDSMGSPNQSLDDSSPADSPMRSVMSSSSIGSPATPLDADLTESMDFQSSLLTLVDPNLVEETNTATNATTAVASNQLPTNHSTDQRTTIFERASTPKQQTPRAEATVNIRNFTCNGKRNIRQLIRVTPVGSGNPRSILLPVNLKDMKEVRTIKIINASQARNLKGFKINQGSVISKAIPMSMSVNIKQEETGSERSSGNSGDDVSETEATPYPRLKLNSEEKRLLQKEGITLPSHYPLTKHEERELKRIRRKIRNKISAQDSRKRKKEYVDGLEDRVKQCTEENMSLLKRIKALQTQNQSLAGQLKRLQALIQKGNKSAQPATCLMVLLLSLALVAAPSLRPHSNNNTGNELSRDNEPSEKMPPIAGRSRSLLHTKQLDDELQQYSDEVLQELEGLIDHDYIPAAVAVPAYKRARYELEHTGNNKYASSPSEHIGGTLNPKMDYPIPKHPKKFFEPPLDDVWPPPPKPGGGIQPATKVVDKLEALTNELKINISDSDGTRTILLKVPPPPHEQLNSST